MSRPSTPRSRQSSQDYFKNFQFSSLKPPKEVLELSVNHPILKSWLEMISTVEGSWQTILESKDSDLQQIKMLQEELKKRNLEMAALRMMAASDQVGVVIESDLSLKRDSSIQALQRKVKMLEMQLEMRKSSFDLQKLNLEESLEDRGRFLSPRVIDEDPFSLIPPEQTPSPSVEKDAEKKQEKDVEKTELQSKVAKLEDRIHLLSQFYNHTGDLMGIVEFVDDEQSDLLILETSPSLRSRYGIDVRGMTLSSTPSPPGFSNFLIQKYQETYKTVKQRVFDATGLNLDDLERLPSLDIDPAMEFELPYAGRGTQNWGVMKLIYLGKYGVHKRGRWAYVLQDKTPVRQLLDQVTLKNAELEGALKIRETFLALISHELRTPIVGIMGFSQLLLESQHQETLNSDQAAMIHSIFQCSELLLTLVNDILDFSKLKAGKLQLSLAPVDLIDTVEKCFEMAQVNITARTNNLEFNLEWDIDSSLGQGTPLVVSIMGDGVRLRQLVGNVLTNAVKFTDEGSVNLKVKLEPFTGECEGKSQPIQLTFLCQDTGCGIPKDRQDLLFMPFRQVDNSMARRHQGTGLGLAICKDLLLLMDGKIWCESSGIEGEGSLFGMTMVVDLLDIKTNGTLGRQKMTTMTRGTSTPSLNDVPGLMISSKNTSTISIGDERITLTTPNFLARAPAPRNFDGSLGQRYPLRILLAEDNQINSQVVLKMLEKLGYDDVPWVSDGIMIMEIIQKAYPEIIPDLNLDFLSFVQRKEELKRLHSEKFGETIEKRFDLILMDLQMPKADGFRATNFIRQILPPQLHPIIIALTANAAESDKINCLQSGFDDHVGKPLRLQTLEQVLQRWGEMIMSRHGLSLTASS